MKVFEYAKEHGMTNAEVKDKFGLKSHFSIIPEEDTPTETASAEEIDAVVIDVVEEVVVTQPAQDLVELELSIRCLGSKSPLWEHRALIGR